MLKRSAEIFFNVVFWILATYFTISIFSLESENIEIINGLQNVTKIYNPKLEYAILTTTFLKVVFFYLNLFYFSKLLFSKKGLKYLILLLFTVFAFLLIERLILSYSCSELCYIAYFKLGIGLYAFHGLISLIYTFFIQWRKDLQLKTALINDKTIAELNLLRSQLQPHFLFNTLNNLLSMVNQNENPKLVKSIDKLSSLLRYVVYETKKDKAFINDEISFIQNFSELQLLRFEDDEIDFKLYVTGKYTQQLIEPGILLCFVENAFKHGVQPEIKSFVYINIDLSEKDVINFEIENTIHPTMSQIEVGGYGLKATEDRLNLVYKENYNLTVNENGTYKVQLEIKTNERNNS